MNPLSIILILIIGISSNQLCPELEVPPVPSKYGLLTVTYLREFQAGQINVFQKYLNHYGSMQCPLFDNIYIIWNNKQSPSEKGISISQKWNKKIFFIKTPYNSMGWRYIIPQNSTQQVFFSIDDDLYFSCEQMKLGFNTWRQNAVGTLAPLISFGVRTMYLNIRTQKFQYDNRIKNQFSFALMGVAFFSKQFSQLYYSQLVEMRLIRKLVQQVKICDDLAFNFVVSYFYPQLLLVDFYGGKPFSYTPGQSSAPDFFDKRSECINQITRILSFNPVKHTIVNGIKLNKMDQSCILLQKQQFYKKVIKKRTIQEIFKSDSIFNPDLPPNQKQSYENTIIQKLIVQERYTPFNDNKYLYLIIALVVSVIISVLLAILLFFERKRRLQIQNSTNMNPIQEMEESSFRDH